MCSGAHLSISSNTGWAFKATLEGAPRQRPTLFPICDDPVESRLYNVETHPATFTFNPCLPPVPDIGIPDGYLAGRQVIIVNRLGIKADPDDIQILARLVDDIEGAHRCPGVGWDAFMLLEGDRADTCLQISARRGAVPDRPGKMDDAQGRDLFEQGKALIVSPPLFSKEDR